MSTSLSVTSQSSGPQPRARRRRGSSGNQDQAVMQSRNKANFSTKDLLQLEMPTEFDLISFVTFLGRRRVTIVPIEQLQLPVAVVEGSHGASMLVQRSTWNNKPVVVKRSRAFLSGQESSFKSYGNFMNDLTFEIQVMFHKPLCDHPNIVKLLGISFEPAAEEEHNTTDHGLVVPILVVEPADARHADLSLLFTNNLQVSFDCAADLASGIADGLTELHAYGIIHADLKPENILLFADSGSPSGFVPKLADFGFSGISPFNQDPRGGTQIWNAPECLRECSNPTLRAYCNSYTRDIYAFGTLRGN